MFLRDDWVNQKKTEKEQKLFFCTDYTERQCDNKFQLLIKCMNKYLGLVYFEPNR